MLLAQIEGFIEIARLGNMRRAADALSISQPALTARLQALEEELAAPLFRRTHTGMVLTPAGRAFLPHADRAIEAIRSGGSLVRELEHGVVGELALAVAPAVSAYVLPYVRHNPLAVFPVINQPANRLTEDKLRPSFIQILPAGNRSAGVLPIHQH